MKSIRIALSIALLSGWALSALADQPGHLKFQEQEFQEKVTVAKDGTKHIDIVPADHVLPGTEVLWNINYEVIGKEPVDPNANFTAPISPYTVYVAGSATNDAKVQALFSVDGGKTFAPPDKLQVKNADGSMRAALPKDYNAIRWVFKDALQPGTKGTVTFHAILQ